MPRQPFARRSIVFALGATVVAAAQAPAAAPAPATAPGTGTQPVGIQPGPGQAGAAAPAGGGAPAPVPPAADPADPQAVTPESGVWPGYRDQVRAAARRLAAAPPAADPAQPPPDVVVTHLEMSKARAVLNHDPAADDETLAAAGAVLMARDWTPESREDIAARLVTVAPHRFPLFVRQTAAKGGAAMVPAVLNQRQYYPDNGPTVEAIVRGLASVDPDVPATLLRLAKFDGDDARQTDRFGPARLVAAGRPAAAAGAPPGPPPGRVEVDAFGPKGALPARAFEPKLDAFRPVPDSASARVNAARIAAIEVLDKLGGDDPARLAPLPDGGPEALKQMMFEGSAGIAQAAADALHRRKLLTDAERELLRYDIPRLLSDGSPQRRSAAAAELCRSVDQPIVARAVAMALRDPDATVRRAVVRGLRAAGDKANPLAPAVAEVIVDGMPDDPTQADRAVLDDATALLMRLPPSAEVASTLSPTLRSPSRRETAELLLATAGPAALPALARTYAAAVDEPDARAAVVRVLGQPELAGPAAEDRLLAALKADPSPTVRAAAAAGLWRAKGRAADARAALAKAVADPDRPARAAAADALAKLGPGPDVPVGPLRDLVRDGTPAERAAGARLLAAVGARAAAETAADLTRMADNLNPVVRWAAASALVQVDANGEYVGKAVVAAVRHQDEGALSRLLPAAAPGAPAAAGGGKPTIDARSLATLAALAADDPDPGIRRMAARARERAGPSGREAPPDAPR